MAWNSRTAAAAAGARAILWEPAPGVQAPSVDASILVRAVPNLRAQLGFIADRFFDAPSASLTVAGITGTNGKTTCAWLLAQALEYCGRRAAYIGTLGGGGIHELADAAAPPRPMPLTLHRLLARLRAAGVAAVAMEVSSHAPGSGPLRRGALSHRGLHQSDARSSRLSRRHGSLRRRQGTAV